MRDLTLSDFPFLASLAGSANPSDRRIWLRVACDHFVAAAPAEPDAAARFVDAVSRQLDKADPSTVLEAARKLAPPGRRLNSSPNSDPSALKRATTCSSTAPPSRQRTSLARSQAVAARPSQSPSARISMRGSSARSSHATRPEVLTALAINSRARLEGAILLRLLRRARMLAEDHGDQRLAELLLQRRPLPPESAVLFLLANPLQRVEILLAAQRAQLGRPPGQPATIAPEIVEELEQAAVARRPKQFIDVLGKALECDTVLAERIADDPSGEPLAVAMAALGAPSDVLVRVLIATDLQDGEPYRRIGALARLNNALNCNAATAVVAALRGEPHARRQAAAAEALAPTRAPALRGASRPASAPQRKAAI